MKFPESSLAHHYLDGLSGIEIGGAAHNPFGLSTWNIDQLSHLDPASALYGTEQRHQCGEVMAVDIVAAGDQLPMRENAVDFVVSSHVIEHFFDPVDALDEWARVARRYLFIICPQRDALGSDRALPLTPLAEIRSRHERSVTVPEAADKHHSRWTIETFREMCAAYGYGVIATEDPDTKVGNGFTVVIKLDQSSDGRDPSGAAPGWAARIGRRASRLLDRKRPETAAGI